MGTPSFDDFVKQQQAREGTADWLKMKNEWLQHLEVLYSSVSRYLQPYVDRGEIKTEYRDASLNEEGIGAYLVKELIIKIGRSRVQLEPVGTRILGANGRVDIRGPRGSLQLLLVDKNANSTNDLIRITVTVGNQASEPAPTRPPDHPAELVWKFLTPPPQRKLLQLNKELFLELLMGTVNG